MIDLIFYYDTEIIFVRVRGSDVTFSTSLQPNKYASIEGLKISKKGVLKEYPDLKNKQDWRDIAIKRFKEHLKSLNNEEEVCKYVISELKKIGYIPKYKQKAGFRREVIK